MLDATVGARDRDWDRVWDRVFGVADGVWHTVVVIVVEGEGGDRVDLVTGSKLLR